MCRTYTRNFFFFLLSIFIDELISTTMIITFLPIPPLGCEKKPMSIKSTSVSKIFVQINTSIFIQTKKANFQYCIIIYVVIFSYLINNLNVYCFYMIKCNFIVFETTTIESYSCFSTMIIQLRSNLWSDVVTELIITSENASDFQKWV